MSGIVTCAVVGSVRPSVFCFVFFSFFLCLLFMCVPDSGVRDRQVESLLARYSCFRVRHENIYRMLLCFFVESGLLIWPFLAAGNVFCFFFYLIRVGMDLCAKCNAFFVLREQAKLRPHHHRHGTDRPHAPPFGLPRLPRQLLRKGEKTTDKTTDRQNDGTTDGLTVPFLSFSRCFL